MAKVFGLSEAASIGLHSMVLLASSSTPLNAIQIAEKTGTSKHHVAKVLQKLTKAGMLSSFRGPTGGFTLNKEPNMITFYNIFEAVEGPIDTKGCPVNYLYCPFEICIFGNITINLNQQFKEYLESKRLSDFINLIKK